MSLFGRPRVESRVFVRALPIMPDRNEKLISYVPTIQSYTGHPFFKKKKKKRRNHSRFGCRTHWHLVIFPASQEPSRPLPRKATRTGPRLSHVAALLLLTSTLAST